MPVGMKACPVEGCQELRDANHLLCLPHWQKTPPDLRYAITWNYIMSRKSSDKDERKKAHNSYAAAARKAIDHHSGICPHEPAARARA